MVWSLFIFPSVQTALGVWMCAVVGLAVTVLLCPCLGSTSFMAAAGYSHDAVLGALLVVMILKVAAQQMCFPTSMVRPPFKHFLTSEPQELPNSACVNPCCMLLLGSYRAHP